MLTGMQIALIGGDARQLEVIRKFSLLDASVRLIGFDNLPYTFNGITKTQLSTDVLNTVDAVVLPPVGTDDSGVVESLFSTRELLLSDDLVEALPKHAKVFTGMAKTYLKTICAKHHIELVELFNRDDVAIYNSIPTAEGAIMMAIQNTDFTIHGSQSIVLGLGRTGFTLARVLQGLGADVKVGIRSPENYARAWEMRLKPFYIAELAQHVANVDLLFNTIPSMIVTAQIIANIPNRALIIDLASKPGGTDFRFAEKRGIKAMLAPGLPGIVAPRTAGRIIANTLSELLMNEVSKRGNGQ